MTNIKKKIKIQSPKIPNNLETCTNISYETFLETIEYRLIENEIISEIRNSEVKIDSCIFRNVVFEDCNLKKIDMCDVIFENCNLSNTIFSNSSIYRVEFKNCKIDGCKVEDSILNSVKFKETRGRYSNFSFSEFKGVEFVDSDFQSAVFQEVVNKGLVLDGNDFNNTFFTGTALKDVDFTTCTIEGIEVRLQDVYGGSFSQIQALELSRFMGIKIK